MTQRFARRWERCSTRLRLSLIHILITVGCEATTPGWIQTDEKGKLSGYDYDVWQEIGKRIGYEIDYKVCLLYTSGEDGSREQEVEIFYRFIGKID